MHHSYIWIFDQCPEDYCNTNYNEESFLSDKQFIKNIEDTLQEESMIYQMPYNTYPENGEKNNMTEYALFTGYIHSETLKWSYGVPKGSYGDRTFEEINKLDLNEQIKKIRQMNFSGIYIDRRAYTEIQ